MTSKLHPEDQARVDSVLHRGPNSIERKPFRGWLLLGVIVAIMTALSFISYGVAWYHGVV